jgi:hypothetical protein
VGLLTSALQPGQHPAAHAVGEYYNSYNSISHERSKEADRKLKQNTFDITGSYLHSYWCQHLLVFCVTAATGASASSGEWSTYTT